MGQEVGYSLERVHSEGNIHARAVREEGSQRRLLKQTKDEDSVPEEEETEQSVKNVPLP